MAKRILVPLDGTPLGEAVLPHVAELARGLGAEVELLHVVPPSLVKGGRGPTRPPAGMLGAPSMLPAYSPSSTVLGYRYDPAEVEATSRYVERVAAWLRGEGLSAIATVVEGPDVAAEILLRSRSYDLLALAAAAPRSATLMGRLVYGSISERIVHEAAIPVLLVRVPNAAG